MMKQRATATKNCFMKTSKKKLLLCDFVAPEELFHVARVRPTARASTREAGIHTHDFAEAFWVESGGGTHFVNGKQKSLQRGDVILIRPRDAHFFRASSRESDGEFVLVNVAFAAETLEFLQSRYFPEEESWPWHGSGLPSHFVVGGEALRKLGAWADSAPSSSQTRLDLEAFLLDLLRMIARPQATNDECENAARVLAAAPDGAIPQWLEHALVRFDEPQHLATGGERLAELANRSPEHLNRVLQSATHRTTTATVNEMRLQYAARQLRLTNRPVADIAADCGLANASHFHRLFRERFGTSPRRFRIKEHATVG